MKYDSDTTLYRFGPPYVSILYGIVTVQTAQIQNQSNPWLNDNLLTLNNIPIRHVTY